MKKYILPITAVIMTALISACGSGTPVPATPIGNAVPATVTQTVTEPAVTETVLTPGPVVTVTKEVPVPVASAPAPGKPASKVTFKLVQSQYDMWCGAYNKLNRAYKDMYPRPKPQSTWVVGAQATLDRNYELYRLAKEGYETDGRVFTPRQITSPPQPKPSHDVYYPDGYRDPIKSVLDVGTPYLKCG